jgi:glycerol-3-phosphate dehydrogenase
MNANEIRGEAIRRLQSETFDLVVIGGGITGAGIALDAVTRGIRTALLERHDFAFGTSSRSTKLIHGGLRYLKQLEFGLVREVGSERAIVHRLAPHLVIPEKMLMPLSERSMSPLLASIGLKIYDWLAGVAPRYRRQMLNRAQTLRAEPLLQGDTVSSGAMYVEYRTDDARLTIELIKTAIDRGAVALNYARVIDFVYREDRLCGVRWKDEESGDSHELDAKVIVNAAGPWVDELRAKNKSLEGKKLHLTKGVHLVVKKKRLPVRQSIYFDAPDGRMIFVIPRGNKCYIGTTDTDYSGLPEDVAADSHDAEYLLLAVNTMFPQVRLSPADIESSWAGLRPLIHEEGKSPSQLSRRDEIFESPSGLLSIAGGKLTAYRRMAERVVDRVTDMLEGSYGSCKTKSLALSGGPFTGTKQLARYKARVKRMLPKVGLEPKVAGYLLHLYGRQLESILERMVAFSKSGDPDRGLILAELEFCIEHEMVRSATDFLVRRTGLVYFDVGRAERHAEAVLDHLGRHLGWSESRREAEREKLQKELAKARIYSRPV